MPHGNTSIVTVLLRGLELPLPWDEVDPTAVGLLGAFPVIPHLWCQGHCLTVSVTGTVPNECLPRDGQLGPASCLVSDVIVSLTIVFSILHGIRVGMTHRPRTSQPEVAKPGFGSQSPAAHRCSVGAAEDGDSS